MSNCVLCKKPMEENQSRILFYDIKENLVSFVHLKCREIEDQKKKDDKVKDEFKK